MFKLAGEFFVRCTPVTLSALHDDGTFTVVDQADGACCKAGAGGTLGVIILPLTP